MADVKVISPDGQSGTVPQENLAAFLDAGGELAPSPGATLGSIATKGAGIATALTSAATGGLLSPVAQTIGKAAARGFAPKVNAVEQSNRDAGGITGGLQGVSDAFDATNMGIGQGLSAGLGEGALRQGVGAFSKEGGQAVEDWANQSSEENGFAHGVGNIAGMAGGLAAGGFGGVAGGIAKIGGLAERGAAAGVAGLGEGSAIARALGTGAKFAAQGAAEGGLYGASEQIGEDMLGDHDLNAEKIAAAFGHGALVGGVLGGGMGAGGSLVKSGVIGVAQGARNGINAAKGGIARLLNRAGDVAGAAEDGIEGAVGGAEDFAKGQVAKGLDALAEQKFGAKAEGIGEKIHDLYSKGSAAVSGKDEELIRKFTNPSAEGAEARRIGVFDHDTIRTDAAKGVREHGDAILKANNLVSDEARGSLKAEHIRASVKTGNEEEVRQHLGAWVDKVLEGTQGELNQEVAPTMVKSIESLSKAAYKVKAALESGADNAALFIEADGLKRAGQRLTSNGYKSLFHIADPIDQINARRTVEFFDKTSEGLRKHLEDTAIWGKSAEQQQAINKAWTRQIDASERFHNALTTKVGRDPNNPYLQVRGIDPQKAENYINGLVNPNKDLTHQAVKDYLESTHELAKAIGESYELPAHKLTEVENIGKSAQAMTDHLSKAERGLILANQYKSLTGDGGGSLIGTTIGGVSGGLLGGAIGAVADVALGSLKNPGRTVAQMASLERSVAKGGSAVPAIGMLKATLDKVDVYLDKAAKGLIVPRTGAAKSVARAIASPPKTAARELAKKIQASQSDPSSIADNVGKSTAAFAGIAPKTASAMAGVVGRSTAWIASQAPPTGSDDPLSPRRPPNMTDADAARFLRKAQAAHDPMKVLADIERGHFNRDQIDALKATSPRLFASLQTKTLDQLADHVAAGKEVPYAARLRLSLVLDVPTDASLRPDTMKKLQSNVEMPPPAPPAPPSNGGGGHHPVKLNIPSVSVYDSLEQHGTGRRK